MLSSSSINLASKILLHHSIPENLPILHLRSKSGGGGGRNKIANATKTSSQYSNIMIPPFSATLILLVTQEEKIFMPRISSHRTS